MWPQPSPKRKASNNQKKHQEFGQTFRKKRNLGNKKLADYEALKAMPRRKHQKLFT